MAPTGSSILNRFSTTPQATMTSTPAIEPMSAAAHGSTNAHGAVMATRPASMPFTIIPGSGFLNVGEYMHQNIAITAPKAAARAVLVATIANWMSVAASVDAALKPNQPNNRMKQPSIAMGMWCAARVLLEPSLLNLPRRGPSTSAPARAATPPMVCTTPEPAKSTYPNPR